MRKIADFSERVYRLVRKCPPGHVVSYGGVAALLGHPRAARGVGSALAALQDGSDVPWWRVINRNGEISIKGTLHGPILQRRLLEAEGVRFNKRGRVEWKEFGWDGGRGRGRGTDSGTAAAARTPAPANRKRTTKKLVSAKKKRSVAVAIAHPADPSSVLVVQRPADDEDLPDAWGLPAASLQGEEDWHAAARRAGRDKLSVTLAIGRELNRGEVQRPEYLLEMRLFEAHIVAGEPNVPQRDSTVTQYQAWKWAEAAVLEPAAQRGSLCCRLYLEQE